MKKEAPINFVKILYKILPIINIMKTNGILLKKNKTVEAKKESPNF